MLHWLQVWKHMRNITDRAVEKRAVMEFIIYFEEQMNMVITQSKKELDKKNKINKIQGLRQNERIDSECVRNAIKTINNNGHSFMPVRAGGKSRKEICKTHSQQNAEVT